MKKIFILLILSLTIQYSFGQACGIYRIKYVGKINSASIKIEKIKLPTIEFLHGLEKENSEKGFIEIEPISNEINNELSSHLTSNLYENTENLLKFYKTKRENIPIIITVIENEKNKNIRTELSWNKIKISKLEDEKFGNLFELNLNEINLNNNPEEKYPWDNTITKVATNAIYLSINNFVNGIKDKNFPSSPGPFNVKFRQKEIIEFQIIGYSYSESNTDIYEIEFQPTNMKDSGNRITVSMNIKTKEALKVYMQADG